MDRNDRQFFKVTYSIAKMDGSDETRTKYLRNAEDTAQFLTSLLNNIKIGQVTFNRQWFAKDGTFR